MAQTATVTALNGRVIVIDSAGLPRLLAVGDALQAGDTVRPAPGASVQLSLDDGQTLGLAGGQAWLVGADAPVAAPPELTEAVNAVIDVLERGGDLDEIEAAAAGAGGGGGGDGDGSSFVRLLRIEEGVTPLAYEYGTETPGRIDEPLLASAAAPEGDEPPPPPPGDNFPLANDDTASARVTITKGAVTDFNGDTRVMGAGEGSLSFEGRLALPHNQNAWLLSDASFQNTLGSVQGAFTITDHGQGSDPAFVVTPNFTASAGQTFDFSASAQLGGPDAQGDTDRFTAELYRNLDGTWTQVATIAGSDGQYSHTFEADGEYRVKFTVDDETGGGTWATATVDVGSDHYFGTVTPLPDIVDIVPASGNILGNDAPGDGDFSQHTWAFDGGVVDPDTGLVTVTGDHGTLVVEPDGDYTYTPSGSTGGQDVFSYTLYDADGDADGATLSVNVAYTVNDLGAQGAELGASAYAFASAEPLDMPSFGVDSDGDGIPDALDTDNGGFTLAHVNDGGDSVHLGDMLDLPEFSAQALDPYLSFGENDAGHAVLQVATGADLNGDGIPDAQQSITFDQVSLLDLQAYAGGSSDVEIIQKLLDNGNLRKDA
ncbi:retention module-containing protein [Aquabacterium sp. A08]|uniref:retention module-containing protein n=1 Tax=Aquabacterium sp. A08 TaxID=2718532 RepID=UPI00141E3610|nr:retention module-containing protein [Aquabacterium sp. A08]NIC41767.1 retention module-containing protein [Aquabacterium sp. A08]